MTDLHGGGKGAIDHCSNDGHTAEVAGPQEMDAVDTGCHTWPPCNRLCSQSSTDIHPAQHLHASYQGSHIPVDQCASARSCDWKERKQEKGRGKGRDTCPPKQMPIMSTSQGRTTWCITTLVAAIFKDVGKGRNTCPGLISSVTWAHIHQNLNSGQNLLKMCPCPDPARHTRKTAFVILRNSGVRSWAWAIIVTHILGRKVLEVTANGWL